MQAQPTGARLPLGSSTVAAQSGNFLPVFSAILRAKQRSIFNPGINGVRISERWFNMPDSLELPGVLRAVIPLVRGERFAGLGRSVVSELVAVALGRTVWGGDRFAGWCSGLVPCFAAVI